jgi:hypothetical protein
MEAGNPYCHGDFYDPNDLAAGCTRHIIVQTMSAAKQLPFGGAGCTKMTFIDVGWTSFMKTPALAIAGKQCSFGADNSAGSGYKLVRVPN